MLERLGARKPLEIARDASDDDISVDSDVFDEVDLVSDLWLGIGS